MTDKATLRGEMRALRRALGDEEQALCAQAVFARLRGLDAYQNARCVMAYIAVRGELSLAPVIKDLLDRGCVLALPRCEAPGVMTARRITSLSQLTEGAYGLLEPDASCEILDPAKLDLILVPGTAFDDGGGRLGQGGGYYDRFLPETKALRVGICHGFALKAHVPADAHDQRMDMIITPEKTVTDCKDGGEHRWIKR